jgi:hypothetical protein
MSEVVEVEQEPIVIQQRYKLYVVDNTSRMHTIRIGNGVVLNCNGLDQIITHENALGFHNIFLQILGGHELFSFRNETCAMIYKTKDLVGIQIVPEEY